MHVSKLIETNPVKPAVPLDRLGTCIEACFDSAQSCIACADACLGEQTIEQLRRCIRLNQDCADVCLATGRMLSRHQHADVRVIRAQLEACLIASATCGDECAMHAQQHEHCRLCAEACRGCARACRDLIAALVQH